MSDIIIPQAESHSADLIKGNIEQLKQLFPEVIKEGRVDFEALNDLLGNYADTPEERFHLNWAGKTNARREAQKRSTGTLRPCPEESVDWESTGNLYIEGDNLEVLKLLQKSYYSRVKMIYIDPPYNTGKDFVYKDNYTDNMKNYLEQTGQDKKLSTNTESDGRYHSNWLNMMYPRLKLARNLLTDDGVIFISIDDNEVANLRKVCDELFGEDNFVAEICHKSRASISNDKIISPNHNIVFFYAKNHDLIHLNRKLYGLDPILTEFNLNDERGEYRLVPVDGPGGARKGNPYYEFQGILGYWRFSKETMQQKYDNGYVVKRGNSLYQKYYKTTAEQTRRTDTTWWDDAGLTSTATANLNSLMGNKTFDTPKPVELIVRMLKIATFINTDSLILDFFSGSATTAHAVMQLNAEDGGNRKYICVQLPEQTPEDSEARKAGYTTIPEIAKERIRRAGKKIVEEQKAKAEQDGAQQTDATKKLDIGFKVFKLDSSNINAWDSSPDNLESTLEHSLFNIKDDRSEDDLLYEILIKYGIELTEKIGLHTIAGKTVYEMGAGSLIVCLADNITTDVAEGICKLYQEVSPEGLENNCRVVFKDAGFNGSDEMKSNSLLILKQHGIINVTSV